MATRILIADDHELMRATLRNLINSHEGWQVCAEAKDGREAVAQAKKLQPDLIVLDLAMPVMDGVQAAREIIKSRPEARVVMFTLHASEEVEKHARRAGVKEVVSKAKNGGRLVTTMEQLLSGSEQTKAIPRETATPDSESQKAKSSSAPSVTGHSTEPAPQRSGSTVVRDSGEPRSDASSEAKGRDSTANNETE